MKGIEINMNFLQEKTTSFIAHINGSTTFLSKLIVRLFHQYFISLKQLSCRLNNKNLTLVGILSLKITELPNALSLECALLQPNPLYSNQKLLITH